MPGGTVFRCGVYDEPPGAVSFFADEVNTINCVRCNRALELRSCKRRFSRMVADADATMSHTEYADHLHTYRGFVKGTVIFAAHSLIILLLLYYFFG
jgi:hypothetical protein